MPPASPPARPRTLLARQDFAAPLTKGAVVASDAFFPFADGLLAAVEAGATAVIQPGGSLRDAEVIRAADDNGIAMVFTGVRHSATRAGCVQVESPPARLCSAHPSRTALDDGCVLILRMILSEKSATLRDHAQSGIRSV